MTRIDGKGGSRIVAGLKRLVGSTRCNECLEHKPAVVCFDNAPDGSAGWVVCDACLRAALPVAPPAEPSEHPRTIADVIELLTDRYEDARESEAAGAPENAAVVLLNLRDYLARTHPAAPPVPETLRSWLVSALRASLPHGRYAGASVRETEEALPDAADAILARVGPPPIAPVSAERERALVRNGVESGQGLAREHTDAEIDALIAAVDRTHPAPSLDDAVSAARAGGYAQAVHDAEAVVHEGRCESWGSDLRSVAARVASLGPAAPTPSTAEVVREIVAWLRERAKKERVAVVTSATDGHAVMYAASVLLDAAADIKRWWGGR